MSAEALIYSYKNVPVHTAAHTEKLLINEVIAYILCEKLLSGYTVPDDILAINNQGIEYEYSSVLTQCLHELDLPNLIVIYEEIKKRVEEISSDIVYQSLLTNGELYIKYDYRLGRSFTQLTLYPDSTDNAWLLW